MRAHDELGFVLAGAADYRVAVTHLEAALEAATTLGDAEGEVSALSRLSIVHANRLDFDAALAFGERALRSSDALHDEHAEAMAMDALKQVALQTGDFETQERLAARLAVIHRRNDDLWMLQFAVAEVAYADLARMRLDRSFAGLDESLAINRRIGDIGNEPMYLAILGRAHRGRGDYDEALAVGRRAFDLARELGHGEWTGWAAAWLGSTLVELGAFGEAAGLLEEGAEAAERSDAGLHLVRCLGTGAWAAERLGERGRAVTLADRAAFILDRIRVRPPRAWVAGYDAYVGVARLRLAIGEPRAHRGARVSDRRRVLGRARGATASWTARSCSWRRRSVEVIRRERSRQRTVPSRKRTAPICRRPGERTEHWPMPIERRGTRSGQPSTPPRPTAGLRGSSRGSMIVRSAKRSCPVERRAVLGRGGAMTVSSLHHVAIRVQDPDRSRAFYEKALGLSFLELPVGNEMTGIWRGAPSEGKLLATQAGDTFVVLEPPLEGTPDDERFSERRIGVDHLAFGIDDRSTLDELVERLRAEGVETAGVEHDPVLDKDYVAFRDPDNVQWELYMR